MNVSQPHSANPSAGLTPFVKTCPEVTTASALRDSAATRSVDVLHVQEAPAFVSHRTNSSEKNVNWPDVQRIKIVQLMLSASRFPEVSVTAPALPDTNPELTEVVKTSTNVAKVCSDLVDSELSAKTNPDHFLALAHLEHLETLTTALAMLSAQNAHRTISVEKTKNVWLLASVFALLPSSPTTETATDARVLVTSSAAASTPSVRPQIHLSVFARLATPETP